VATFKRFEEMHSWQSARDLVKLVYEVTEQSDAKANITERQINALIGYLTRTKDQKSIREKTVNYTLDLPEDII
jgi:hypothetical protein